MTKIKEKEIKIERVPLKRYSVDEIKSWNEKFKGLHNNEKGVIFGAYTKTTRKYPASEWKKEPYFVDEYAVIPERVPEFENLLWQINSMNFGEMKKVEGLQEMADQVGIF